MCCLLYEWFDYCWTGPEAASESAASNAAPPSNAEQIQADAESVEDTMAPVRAGAKMSYFERTLRSKGTVYVPELACWNAVKGCCARFWVPADTFFLCVWFPCAACRCCDLRKTILGMAIFQFFLGTALCIVAGIFLSDYLAYGSSVPQISALYIYQIVRWGLCAATGIMGVIAAANTESILQYSPQSLRFSRIYSVLCRINLVADGNYTVWYPAIWKDPTGRIWAIFFFVPITWDIYITYLAISFSIKLRRQQVGIFEGRTVINEQARPDHLLELEHPGACPLDKPPPEQVAVRHDRAVLCTPSVDEAFYDVESCATSVDMHTACSQELSDASMEGTLVRDSGVWTDEDVEAPSRSGEFGEALADLPSYGRMSVSRSIFGLHFGRRASMDRRGASTSTALGDADGGATTRRGFSAMARAASDALWLTGDHFGGGGSTTTAVASAGRRGTISDADKHSPQERGMNRDQRQQQRQQRSGSTVRAPFTIFERLSSSDRGPGRDNGDDGGGGGRRRDGSRGTSRTYSHSLEGSHSPGYDRGLRPLGGSSGARRAASDPIDEAAPLPMGGGRRAMAAEPRSRSSERLSPLARRWWSGILAGPAPHVGSTSVLPAPDALNNRRRKSISDGGTGVQNGRTHSADLAGRPAGATSSSSPVVRTHGDAGSRRQSGSGFERSQSACAPLPSPGGPSSCPQAADGQTDGRSTGLHNPRESAPVWGSLFSRRFSLDQRSPRQPPPSPASTSAGVLHLHRPGGGGGVPAEGSRRRRLSGGGGGTAHTVGGTSHAGGGASHAAVGSQLSRLRENSMSSTPPSPAAASLPQAGGSAPRKLFSQVTVPQATRAVPPMTHAAVPPATQASRPSNGRPTASASPSAVSPSQGEASSSVAALRATSFPRTRYEAYLEMQQYSDPLQDGHVVHDAATASSTLDHPTGQTQGHGSSAMAHIGKSSSSTAPADLSSTVPHHHDLPFPAARDRLSAEPSITLMLSDRGEGDDELDEAPGFS